MGPDQPTAEALAEQIARLRADYLTRLPAELAALRDLIAGMDGGGSDRPRLEELHHRLHRLAGSGGSFGLATLSLRARDLEQRVGHWLAAPVPGLDAQLGEVLAADVAALADTTTELIDARVPVARPERIAPVSGKTVHVWLIEDDRALAGELIRQFESFGYLTHHFTRISDAETAAEAERPDMLITDIVFPEPEENATEVLSRRPLLRKLGCPLLFISSRDDFQSRVNAARLGAEGYFLKPLDVPRLVNRMVQIYEQRRAPPQRVLVVDDDVDLAEHYRLVLEAAGMEAEILHQHRHQAIIETVTAFRPELVLMDLHMPVYSGPELAGVIRQYDRWASLPIVYLSAETDLDRQIEAMGHGADDFLTKPIADAQLVATVRSRIGRARLLDAQISRDSLTGLLKHANIKEAVEMEMIRARRLGTPVTVAMVDIDHFKTVNDSYGHAVGDVVISSIAMLLRQRLRKSDIVGRYGGEEFLAVLPQCNINDAQLLLDDIRQRFAALHFSHYGDEFCCTLSAGLACATQYPDAGADELLAAADAALYVAKRSGRNQVRLSAGDRTRDADRV